MMASEGRGLPATDELLTAARVYAATGWRVIPLYGVRHGVCSCPRGSACSSPGKHPLLRSWQSAATTDLAAMEAWFGSGEPRNIGIATGQRLVVIDVDGKEGEASLAELESKHAKLPPTATVCTGRGRHLYFCTQYVVKIRNRSGQGALATGLDVRGDGGLVVAPPSAHASGKSYEWPDGLGPPALAEAPACLLSL